MSKPMPLPLYRQANMMVNVFECAPQHRLGRLYLTVSRPHCLNWLSPFKLKMILVALMLSLRL